MTTSPPQKASKKILPFFKPCLLLYARCASLSVQPIGNFFFHHTILQKFSCNCLGESFITSSHKKCNNLCVQKNSKERKIFAEVLWCILAVLPASFFAVLQLHHCIYPTYYEGPTFTALLHNI